MRHIGKHKKRAFRDDSEKKITYVELLPSRGAFARSTATYAGT